MHVLDSVRTAQVLPYSRLVPAVRRAAIELAAGTIIAPERQVITLDPSSVLLSMPAIGADIGVTKLITVHAANRRHGLPAIQGEVVVFDTATGKRHALLDGPTVTARRTAAMTLLGIETLAPRKPASVLLIGTGVQAAAHADALVEYLGIDELQIAGTTLARAESFAAAVKMRYRSLTVSAHASDSIKRELPSADVLITLTTARAPVLPPTVAADMLVVGVGAFKPDMAELPPGLLHARPIVVDDLAGARHEAGDLIQAGIDWSGVAALADILSGKTGRLSQVPVFKTVGQAAWDLAAARVALGALPFFNASAGSTSGHD